MYLATVKEGAFTFQLMALTQLLYQTIQLRIVLMEAHFLASVFAILVQILPSKHRKWWSYELRNQPLCF